MQNISYRIYRSTANSDPSSYCTVHVQPSSRHVSLRCDELDRLSRLALDLSRSAPPSTPWGRLGGTQLPRGLANLLPLRHPSLDPQLAPPLPNTMTGCPELPVRSCTPSQALTVPFDDRRDQSTKMRPPAVGRLPKDLCNGFLDGTLCQRSVQLSSEGLGIRASDATVWQGAAD